MRIKWLSLFFLVCLFSCEKKPPKCEGPKVSVISPTYKRPERHPQLYEVFRNQTYSNKELLVLDDSPEPSLFFTSLKDPRVIYQHNPEKQTVGTKRNQLVEMASGEIIAQFDDDDYYAPLYLEKMVGYLGGADLVKLSTWLAWRETDGTLWEWDTSQIGQHHHRISGWGESDLIVDITRYVQDETAYVEGNKWGFGFSYVFRKALWEDCKFPDLNAGEDGAFALTAKKMGKNLIAVAEHENLVLHVLHSHNASRIFPQKKFGESEYEQCVSEDAKSWLLKTATSP